MNVSATVRVRPGAADQDTPDRARLEQAARLLKQSGFDVLSIAPVRAKSCLRTIAHYRCGAAATYFRMIRKIATIR